MQELSQPDATRNTHSLAAIRESRFTGKTRLQQICESEIKEEDLKSIVSAFVQKAKNGDLRSAQFVNDVLLGGSCKPQQVVINQFYEGNEEQRSVVTVPSCAGRDDVASRVTSYLSCNPDKTPQIIAADLELDEPEVIRVLDTYTTRFHVTGNRYSLAR